MTVFFLDLMPRLKRGVIVHIHDIFLPSDYPPEWERKMYSEQYILAAMLLCPTQPFKVLLPNFYIECDAELRGQVAAAGPCDGGVFLDRDVLRMLLIRSVSARRPGIYHGSFKPHGGFLLLEIDYFDPI